MRRAVAVALCGLLSLATPVRAQTMGQHGRTAHRVTVSVRGHFPSTEDTRVLIGHGFSRDHSGRAHWGYFVPRVLDDLTQQAFTNGQRKAWHYDCRTLEHAGHRWATRAALYLGCD